MKIHFFHSFGAYFCSKDLRFGAKSDWRHTAGAIPKAYGLSYVVHYDPMHGGKSLYDVRRPQKVVSADTVAPYAWEGALALPFSVILPKNSTFEAKI